MHFWGKHDPNSSPASHPLADHCLDVALTLRRIAALPRVHAALQACTATPLQPVHIERLAAVAYLHDVGKCNWGFQAKCRADASRTTGHVLEGAALLHVPEVQRLCPHPWFELLSETSEWFDGGEEQLRSMLLAAISHHGRPVSDNDLNARPPDEMVRWWQPHRDVEPMRGLAQLVSRLREAIPDAFVDDAAPIAATPALQQRFAGLVMLADWIGSDTQFFPYRQNDEEDRPALAAKAASRAVASIGLATPLCRRALPFAETFGFAPSALQTLMALDQPVNRQSQLVLAESDTGSGKTEAALAWFLRLYAQGRVDGLYFALPTRVAARELYVRVCHAVDRAFPDATERPGPVLLAVPGYVRVDGVETVLPDPEGRLWEDDARVRQRERLWSTERPKRFLAAPIAVGTIDQALLSALQVKHALLRSVCLDRHLLVVDEVHASDPYMSEVLKALLDGHVGRGGCALLLSATLGESARASYFGQAPLPLEAAQNLPYPAVTDSTGTMPVPPTGRRKPVRITQLDRLDDAAS